MKTEYRDKNGRVIKDGDKVIAILPEYGRSEGEIRNRQGFQYGWFVIGRTVTQVYLETIRPNNIEVVDYPSEKKSC